MKRTPATILVELVKARSGNRHDCVRGLALSLVVSGSFLLQGCLAGAWLAAVTVDAVQSGDSHDNRGSDISFEPFEHSWVAPKLQSGKTSRSATVTSVAVLPVEGDSEMGARLATLFQQETDLRVEAPTTVSAEIAAADPDSAKANEADRRALAKEVTRSLDVDTVLVSRVVAGSSSHPSDWGRKADGTRRLYLYLMNRDGQLLWKDELPFTPAKGSTIQQEASVQTDLSEHVMQHVKELRLDEIGYLPKKALLRTPRKIGTLTR